MISKEYLKSSVLSFVKKTKSNLEKPFSHGLTPNSDHTIFTSCFAVKILSLLDEVKNFSESERIEWINYIQSFQSKTTGLFIDTEASKRVVGEEHNVDHLALQLTTFCVTALDCLSSKARYPLHFVKKYYGRKNIFNILDNLDWNRSSNSGNKSMFIAISLIYNFENFADKEASNSLNYWFEWMDANQRSGTGFWGTNKESDYFEGLGGFYHQFVIYAYMNRKVNLPKRIIDRILYLQQPDGLFYPGNGGASCDDIDGITPLVYFYKRYDYRRDEIKIALEKALDSILKNRRTDGGFCWGQRDFLSLKTYKHIFFNIIYMKDNFYWFFCIKRFIIGKLLVRLAKPKIATGWSKYSRYEFESSLFDTWLRLVTIGEICSIVDDVALSGLKLNYQKVPGLCWFK